MKGLRIAFFLSDEGFGHTVRQEAIIKEFLRRIPNAQITAITHKKLSVLKEKLGDQIEYVDQYNNIHTVKTAGGDLDLQQTKEILKAYPHASDTWIERMERELPIFDCAISDFVPEAFELCSRREKPCFGVAHFTWDWFYSSLFPEEENAILKMQKYAAKATKIFFPPFTPEGVLNRFFETSINVSFIINDFAPIKIKHKGSKTDLKCLIMDNGTSTLVSLIEEGIRDLADLNQVQFFVSAEKFSQPAIDRISRSKNINPVYGLKEMHSHIPHMDFIVARGGFNTITECLITKTPSILVEEGRNPEVAENIRQVKESGFCSSIQPKDFHLGLKECIEKFLLNDYEKIKEKMLNAKFENSGPAEICSAILKDAWRKNG